MEYLLRHRPGWLRGYTWFGGRAERSTAIGRGAVVALSIRIASAALAFAGQILLARWLGSFEFGVFTYASVWLNVVGSLCAAGFGASALQFLPAYRVAGDDARARGYIVTGRWASVLTGMAGTAALTALFLPRALGEDPSYAPALVLVAAALPAYALTDFQDGIGRSQDRIAAALAPPYILRPVLMLALAAVLISGNWAGGAVAAAAALAVATWCAAAVQLAWQEQGLRRAFPTAERHFDLKPWFSVSLPLLMVDGFALLMTNLDVMLLEIWVGPKEVGIYFAAIKSISLIAFIQFAISAAASAQLSALRSSGARAELAALLSRAQAWSLVPSLICAAPLLMFGKGILTLFGDEFVEGYPAMAIVAVGLIARAAAGPSQSLLIVGGRQTQAAMILGAAVLINLVLCGLLIPGMGLTGAALATAAAFGFEAAASIVLAGRLIGRGQTNSG